MRIQGPDMDIDCRGAYVDDDGYALVFEFQILSPASKDVVRALVPTREFQGFMKASMLDYPRIDYFLKSMKPADPTNNFRSSISVKATGVGIMVSKLIVMLWSPTIRSEEALRQFLRAVPIPMPSGLD